MASTKTEDLKYLGFVKEIALKFIAVLSNVYEYAKENTGSLKSTVVFLEDATVATMGPVYDKVKDVLEQILVFVDEQIDKYTPNFIKGLATKIQLLIQKVTPSVEKLLTAAKSLVAPLITTIKSLVAPPLTAAKSLLQKAFTHIKSLLPKFLTAIKTLLQNLFTTIKSLLQNLLSLIESVPIIGKIQSLLQKGVDAIKSKFQSSDGVKSESVLDEARDTAGNIVGNIPVVGDTAKTLLTNPLGLVGQVIDKTGSIVENTPVIGGVASAAEDLAKEAQIMGLKTAIKSAFAALNVVALPAIAQFWYKANKYPLFHSLAEVILPVVEILAKWYNHVVKYMDGKDYTLFSFLPLAPIEEMKAAYKVVKATMDGLSAVGDLTGLNN